MGDRAISMDNPGTEKRRPEALWLRVEKSAFLGSDMMGFPYFRMMLANALQPSARSRMPVLSIHISANLLEGIQPVQPVSLNLGSILNLCVELSLKLVALMFVVVGSGRTNG